MGVSEAQNSMQISLMMGKARIEGWREKKRKRTDC